MELSEFATRLKEIRTILGFTQKEMSEKLGCSRASYAYYETDKNTPDINFIKALHDLPELAEIPELSGISFDYLLGYPVARKLENIDIVQKYGLSEEAIHELSLIKEIGYTSAFNLFITSTHFPHFLEALALYHYHHEWPHNDASEDGLTAYAEDEKYNRYECWKSMDNILDDVAKIAQKKTQDSLQVMEDVKKELSDEKTDNTDETPPQGK